MSALAQGIGAQPRMSGGREPSHLRRDVQGLRAVAVLAVIANHAVGWPAGGFLGVDVFFVISGFIITALLLRESDRTGRISLAEFYRRRVRRIMPASVVVLVVTVGASWVLLGGEQARSIALDALAAVFFVSNWRFAAEGTDYWADTGAVSPLQHYWSLGVEEQFYLVWPAILILCLLLAARRRVPSRRVLAIALGAILVGSLAWGALETLQRPGIAYFSSLTRAWELALGALVAVGAPLLARLRDAWRPRIVWVGLAALAFALLTSGSEGMPVPGALLAVVATAVVIAGGTGGREPDIWPLTNRASTYVGDLSFSLYLWHFPVVVFLAPRFDAHERKFLAVVLAVTLVLAVVTYHLVENPVRRSAWLARGSGRMVWVATIGGVALLIAGLVAAGAVRPPAPAAAAAEPTAITSQAQLDGLLRDALAATAWPALDPAPADVAVQGMPEEDGAGCSNVDLADPSACWFPHEGAERTAVVMGDSTGIVLLPMIRAALGDGWNVKALTMAACYQVDIPRWYDNAEHERTCEEHQAGALAEVERLSPDLVFVSNLYSGVWHLEPAVDALDGGGVYQWALETERLAEQLKRVTDDVVFVQSPPRREALGECAVAGSSPSACVHEVDALYREVAEGERAAVRSAGAAYVTVEEWFCADGRCPAFVGTTPTMRDEMHVTRQYAEMLAPLLREKLGERIRSR
ncbi:acyltransferase [Microbacterium barkeri]|uniref:Acyltransferase n=1 Tax=Microbacterium barkeri TaxID=33917 RepID=A0A9W6LY14_9MICO|nr:acyltransferase family protein [Microbacterium barkeri]MDR6875111.1 peptidoglycan/LPS O-acetylase OafA/YrhL [Microbacterium barkeri]GLJ62800.1 acyltransferase [Microbacterium barkeri]